MKRLLSLVAMLLVAFAVCQGQVNPQPGYVVTLQGDTLRGTIDFRSDTRNATVCSFRKDGETQFTDYHPEDISSYRIGDGGAFYVSYVVPVQGKDQRLFVQYLLKGGVNLYYLKRYGINFYYVEGEDGRMVEICDYELLGYDATEARDLKRKNLVEAGNVFHKDMDIVHQLWKEKVTARDLTKLVQEYDEKYCTDTECINFQYDEEKTAKFTNKWFIEAGGGFASVKMYHGLFESTPSLPSIRLSGPIFQVGVSNDISFGRISKIIDFQTTFHIYLMYLTKDDKSYLNVCPDVLLGPKLKLSSSPKCTPFIRAGIGLCDLLGADHSKGLEEYETYNHGFFENHFCYYGGFGVDFHAAKRDYRVAVNYNSYTLTTGSYFFNLLFGISL